MDSRSSIAGLPIAAAALMAFVAGDAAGHSTNYPHSHPAEVAGLNTLVIPQISALVSMNKVYPQGYIGPVNAQGGYDLRADLTATFKCRNSRPYVKKVALKKGSTTLWEQRYSTGTNGAGDGGKPPPVTVTIPQVKLATLSELTAACGSGESGALSRQFTLESTCGSKEANMVTVSTGFTFNNMMIPVKCNKGTVKATVTPIRYRHSCPAGYSHDGKGQRDVELTTNTPATCYKDGTPVGQKG